jgi:hypothetical protein
VFNVLSEFQLSSNVFSIARHALWVGMFPYVDLVWFRSRSEYRPQRRVIFLAFLVSHTWITVEKNGRPEDPFEGVKR